MNLEEKVQRLMEDSLRVKQEAARLMGTDIARTVMMLIEAFMGRKKIILCGNGGSAADAQHIAAELVSRFYLERRALPALALNVNTSVLTAIGNDYDYADTFARQVEAFGQFGDVLIGISTSGNSENVLLAMQIGREQGLRTIGMTGESGGKMKELSDILLAVPSRITPRIQEVHIMIGHIICELVEAELFGKEQTDE